MNQVSARKLLFAIIMINIMIPASTGYLIRANAASTLDNAMKPMVDSLDQMQPAAVFKNFYDLTQIPRPSHNEEKATAFLAAFGHSLNLETITDDLGNVIIRKPATEGYEDRHTVVLQAHMDVVPQKTADKTHDFLKDPITAYVKDGWLTADRTTLGADDGIGVATIMAILQDKDMDHGPIEALFTVDEEDGFAGVNGLAPGMLKGDYLINIDWETEGTFAIGSAGGEYVDAAGKYKLETTPSNMVGYRISITGLHGGHSGMDINKGGGSATKLVARLLWSAGSFNMRIASINSGDRYNAIARDAVAVVAVPEAQETDFENFIRSFEKTAKSELASTEPALNISAVSTDRPVKVMNDKSQVVMLNAIYGSVHGVQRMSDSVPDLVETSCNLGIFTADKGEWKAGILVRSAVDSARDDTVDKLSAVMRLAGADVKTHGSYSGWRPDVKSPLLVLLKDVYQKTFGKEAGLVAVHAGLETSVISAKYPEMVMVSVGPTLQNVHSPEEQLEIFSVGKVYHLLAETLKRIPNK